MKIKSQKGVNVKKSDKEFTTIQTKLSFNFMP